MYLGLDLGTSALKGMLVDSGGRHIATTSAPLSVSRPQAGWSEQDPADWIHAAEAVFDSLCQSHPAEMKTLAGIGLSGQMHGATLLDQADTPLAPCILWNDSRSHKEAAELDALPLFRALTGNIVFPGFTAPKLLWVQRHLPNVFSRIAKVLLPKDYLRLWLSGEAISDMSDASGTGWLDVGKRDWSERLLNATGLDLDHMPALIEGTARGGNLRASLARRWGLPVGIPIAGGAGDNAASAIGMGILDAGSAFVSLGTSGVLFTASDRFAPNPASAVHGFCHALPDRWHQMGVILSATDALNWYAGIVGDTAANLTASLGPLQPPGHTIFLPYLNGERTPHNDAKMRGAFIGLSHREDRAALTRAVLEGVGFAFRDNLAALAATGHKPDRLIAIGGGAQSGYWLQLLASTLELPIDIPRHGDFGAAFGAARLGMIAATDADPASICTAPNIARTIEPDTRLTPRLLQSYHRYRAAYPALKGL